MKAKVNKYRNKKVTVDNITYDSVKEALRHKDLLLLERAGEIQKLERQVEYILIPSQRINGKVVERPVKYKADFVYLDKFGKLIVEDVKGYKTKEFIIKRKLMLQQYGIRIKET